MIRLRAWRLAAFLSIWVIALTLFGPRAALAQAGTAPTTPIKHLVMVMQENHSFDNYFGTYPGADGLPAGVCMPVDPQNPKGECIQPFHIGDADVDVADPDHSDSTFRKQYNNGQLNGFVSALNLRNQDGRMAMGYYDDRDLPYYWNLADRYVLFDRFFSSAASGSRTNHLFWVAAGPGSDPKKGQPDNSTLTIFDRLQERGISWKLYVQNYEPNLTYRTVDQFPGNRASQVVWAPLLGMDRFIDDPNLASHIVDLSEYYTDLQNGTLPAVSYIVPSGPSEHPPSNVQSGQRFVRSLIQALMRSDAWAASAFIVSYDDWGGWYDHVLPPQIDDHGYGFRVPAFLVSPYARQGFIDHTQLDYTSVLRFIEENYGLKPLTTRDASAISIAGAFDFSQPPRPAEYIPWSRNVPQPASPRRSVINLLYGAAALLLAGLVLGAAVGDPTARLIQRGYRVVRRAGRSRA